MTATLTLAHMTIGVEVRRGPYDVVLDGEHGGSVELNQTFETSVEPVRQPFRRATGGTPAGR